MKWLAALALLLAYQTAEAQTIPREAEAWKRQYVKVSRQVWGLNAPAWLAAQIGQESGWRDGLISPAGAMGLCQFIPATASGIERQYAGLSSWGRYSPSWCFYAQGLLMRDNYKTWANGRDECNRLKFAGAGYNGSPAALNREIAMCAADRRCDPKKWDENVATKMSRVDWAYKENRAYVFRITQREGAYAAAGWGVQSCGLNLR